MSNENQIGSLEDMTKESFENRPSQAIEAINEYLANLKDESPEKAKSLEDRLQKDAKFLEQFKVAITHTSLMIFLMSVKASTLASQTLEAEGKGDSSEESEYILSQLQIQIDFDKYVREFLLFSRQDDKDIYDMRLFYMNGLTGEQLELNKVNEEMFESKAEREAAQKKANIQLAKYDELLNGLKKQYSESKIYLK